MYSTEEKAKIIVAVWGAECTYSRFNSLLR